MKYTYKTHGVCSRQIMLDVDENGIIREVSFLGGCDGNLKGISMLSVGQKAEDVIARLQGIRCGFKSTSCPDQLAQALQEMMKK